MVTPPRRGAVVSHGVAGIVARAGGPATALADRVNGVDVVGVGGVVAVVAVTVVAIASPVAVADTTVALAVAIATVAVAVVAIAVAVAIAIAIAVVRKQRTCGRGGGGRSLLVASHHQQFPVGSSSCEAGRQAGRRAPGMWMYGNTGLG